MKRLYTICANTMYVHEDVLPKTLMTFDLTLKHTF